MIGIASSSRTGWRGGVILIQRCAECGLLRHPPQPLCAQCRSFAWETVQASGRGRIYTFAIHHAPPLPGLPNPNAILLVDLDEGVRMIGDLIGDTADPALAIGAPVTASIVADEDDDMLLVRLAARQGGGMTGFGGRTAIAGIGATTFSKNSGVSELHLAAEAILAAVADAGLEPEAIDGLVTFDFETNRQIEVAQALGLRELRFFSLTPFGGGGACAVIQHAALAVATGVAETVVCYRAFNERSGRRFGNGQILPPSAHPSSFEVSWGWGAPHGLLTAATLVAMVAQRYCYEHGVTSEDFGRVSVIERANAATNPNAWFYGRPITLADHQASPWIAEPLHLLDCCQESDGGVALVVTSVERARQRGGRVAVIKAAAQGFGPQQGEMTSYARENITRMPEISLMGHQLWSQSGLTHDDIDVLMLYDHFTPYVLIQLEELGFCGRGEAAALVASGALNLDGRWPLNPNGGLLGEAYVHGFNILTEAVRQVRGEAVNQIKDATNVIVTGGTGRADQRADPRH